MTAGVRGLQPVTFVVTSAEKPVEAATLNIRNAKGKAAGTGSSNDWGEFATSLNPGHYTVSIEWRGHTSTQSVTIDTNTAEIPFKLKP